MSDTFDVIVVGAGSAGCVVAGRLAERGFRVALLEAGGSDQRPDVMVPGASGLLHRSSADWQDRTVPQSHLYGRRVYYPRGKVVGGSGSTNTLVYMRGHPKDYTEWVLDGAAGWSWDDVLPVFRRLEHRHDIEGGSKSGPMHVVRPGFVHPLGRAFVAAAIEQGLRENADFNGDTMLGVGPYPLNLHRGIRWSSARSHLRPAQRRHDLTLITGAFVERLTFAGTRCTGVAVRRGRTRATLHARGRVVLAAGAINTPRLLMLSGIGPGEHLQQMGCAVLVDNPHVGQHLADHPLLPLADIGGESTTNTTLRDLRPVMRYLAGRGGPLSVTLPSVGGYARVARDGSVLPGSDASPGGPREDAGPGGDDERPHVQFHFAPGWAHDIYDFEGLPSEDGYTLTVTVSKPGSRGSVQLAGPHPSDPPAIDPGFLADADDLEPLIGGARLAQRIFDARAFTPHRVRPARPERRMESDDEIEDYVRRNVESNYHPVGSCRMGARGDAVVSPRLDVYGVDGLDVADASVMPRITTGNTNAPVLLIGERAADFVGERLRRGS